MHFYLIQIPFWYTSTLNEYTFEEYHSQWTKDTYYNQSHTDPRRTHGYIWCQKGKNQTNSTMYNTYYNYHITMMWTTLHHTHIHTEVYHRYWWLIHTELSRLVSPKWTFIRFHREKCLRTIWREIETVQHLLNRVLLSDRTRPRIAMFSDTKTNHCNCIDWERFWEYVFLFILPHTDGQ